MYCQQPTSFVDTPTSERRLSSHAHALRLTTSSVAWFERFIAHVTSHGFSQSRTDSSLFVLRHGTRTAYLLLYVDGMILNAPLVSTPRHRPPATTGVCCQGHGRHALLSRVHHTEQGFLLSQPQYADDLLEQIGMDNCKSAPTPVDTSAKSSKDDDLIDDASITSPSPDPTSPTPCNSSAFTCTPLDGTSHAPQVRSKARRRDNVLRHSTPTLLDFDDHRLHMTLNFRLLRVPGRLPGFLVLQMPKHSLQVQRRS